MLKKYVSLMGLIVGLYACSSPNKEVSRVENPDYTVVSEGLYTRMPGSLFSEGEYIVWVDPFVEEDFLHVLDGQTGKELAVWGNIGEGPQEFNLPMVSFSHPPYVDIYDMNKDLQATLSLNRVSVDSLALSVEWSSRTLNNCARYLRLGKGAFLSFFPGGTSPFVLDGTGRSEACGKFPIEAKIENGFDRYQGELIYNDKKKCLLYSTYLFPYVSLYEYKDNRLQLLWEKSEDKQYSVKDNLLVLDKNAEAGFYAVAFTKDYIIGARRDVAIEGALPDDIHGRDFRSLPQSLFVYNYDFELQRILNLGKPIVRLSGNAETNEVCLIVAEQEFSIIKLSVDI